MQNKQILEYKNIRQDIIRAVDIIADPIRQTMSPKGLNVLFEDSNGDFFSTNDGVTIARQITVSDSVHRAIIEIIKSASLRTNAEVGDGTSTTVLLSQILVKEAFKLIDSGMNPMDVKKEFERFANTIVKNLKKSVITIKNDKELENIASIAANNDPAIAKDIVRTVKVAGQDGMVFIEPNNKSETQIVEDTGFIVESGLFAPELRNHPDKFVSSMLNPIVFITDKRLYYPEEAETILTTALMNGYKNIVVVARDFIGQAPAVFIANHGKDANILLVKDPNATDKDASTLEDLAYYLGGKIIQEKKGSLVNNITINDFCIASKVFSDPRKTIISTNKTKSRALNDRISAIKKELENDKDNKSLKKRLASLTNGMVTIKVGAYTQIEMSEKIFRYEDAINATRAAMKDGYLVGGGLAVYNSFNPSEHSVEFQSAYRKFAEGNIRQIAENCGKHVESIIEKSGGNVGYNALTDKIEDLLRVGVVDPYKVTEMAINNAISIVGQIISSNFIIVNEKENDKE